MISSRERFSVHDGDLMSALLLQKLAKDTATLREEFKMNPVDIMKLTTYVNEGHLPHEEKK
jgi:hypothetical protein